MAGINPATLALAKKSDAEIAAGIDHYEVEGQDLKIFTTSGSQLRMTFPIPDPIGVENVYINANAHLIVELSNGVKKDCGDIRSGVLTSMVVSKLPTTNISSTTIYLLSSKDSKGQDMYEEYIYVNDHWERFGSRDETNEVVSENIATISDLDGIFG